MIKKGQTLIEVTVALSIMIIVFSATVNLIVGIVNLTMNSRDRTEAVVLAQRYLSEAGRRIEDGCERVTFAGETSSVEQYTITISGTGLDDNLAGLDVGYTFIRLKSTVTWLDKNNKNNTYEVFRIVRAN